MSSILFRNARVLTMGNAAGPRCGAAMGRLGVIPDADLLITDGMIQEVTDNAARRSRLSAETTIEAAGRVLMPAFVDAHTHACWAGDRLGEWERKLGGATYLELLSEGGGIVATVGAVRSASVEELTDRLLDRLNIMLRHGTTMAEVKSGYGLSTEAEMKMLLAIDAVAQRWPGRIHATACLGHAVDPAIPHDAFVRNTIAETLPAVHDAFPDVCIDAYCEQGAWSLDDCLLLFDRAQSLGHPVRVHADQFQSLGMIPCAIQRKYRSVDHLEATSPDDLQRLAVSDLFGVMLPCSGFQVDGRYADGRGFVDAGGKLVIASNLNPGSAPCFSMPFAIALATRQLGLSPAEAICAATTNAAALLGDEQRGRLHPGQRADVVLLHHTDERQLAYEFGGNPVDVVVCGGDVVFASNVDTGTPTAPSAG